MALNDSTPRRAAGYARFSTDKQTENSIDAQLTAIRRYCEQNDISLVATFVDMAMSGTNTQRPDFQRMIEAAKAHEFDCIVIYDISRASRDVVDWLGFRKLMRSLDIAVLSTTERLGNIDDPNAFLTELLTAGLGQHMVLQTRQKSIAGVAERAKHGVFLGGYPPLGYVIENGAYVVNEREARAVQLIFAMYANGFSYDSIVAELSKMGIKGKRGNTIGRNGLNQILKNERYIGVYTWNKRRMKYMGKYAGGMPNPDGVRIENAIPAIIDRETWDRVHRRMKNNHRRACNTAKRKYLLAGLIECSQCGGAYTGRTTTSSKGYETRYYVCGNKYRNHTCGAQNINADMLEAAVLDKLREYFAGGDFDVMAERVYKAYCKSINNHAAEQKELAKVESEIANIIKAIRTGLDCEDLRADLSRLQARRAELNEILSISPHIAITPELIADKLKKDAQSLGDNDLERLLKSYVTKIYAHRDEIVITGGVNIVGCGGRI